MEVYHLVLMYVGVKEKRPSRRQFLASKSRRQPCPKPNYHCFQTYLVHFYRDMQVIRDLVNCPEILKLESIQDSGFASLELCHCT